MLRSLFDGATPWKGHTPSAVDAGIGADAFGNIGRGRGSLFHPTAQPGRNHAAPPGPAKKPKTLRSELPKDLAAAAAALAVSGSLVAVGGPVLTIACLVQLMVLLWAAIATEADNPKVLVAMIVSMVGLMFAGATPWADPSKFIPPVWLAYICAAIPAIIGTVIARRWLTSTDPATVTQRKELLGIPKFLTHASYPILLKAMRFGKLLRELVLDLGTAALAAGAAWLMTSSVPQVFFVAITAQLLAWIGSLFVREHDHQSLTFLALFTSVTALMTAGFIPFFSGLALMPEWWPLIVLGPGPVSILVWLGLSQKFNFSLGAAFWGAVTSTSTLLFAAHLISTAGTAAFAPSAFFPVMAAAAIIGALIARRWFRRIPRADQKALLNTPTTLPAEDLKRLASGIKPARSKVLDEFLDRDPMDSPESIKDVPLISRVAEWDPSYSMREKALEILEDWSVVPDIRTEVRKKLKRLKTSKSPYAASLGLDDRLDRIDRIEKEQWKVIDQNAPGVGSATMSPEEAEILRILKQADEYLELEPRTAPDRLWNEAVAEAVKVLKRELAGSDKRAKSIAVVRLRRLLRNARHGGMAAVIAAPRLPNR